MSIGTPFHRVESYECLMIMKGKYTCESSYKLRKDNITLGIFVTPY